MTRLDTFIKTMMLANLEIIEHDMSAHQKDILSIMMKELYQNEKLAHLTLEHRVLHLVDAYKRKFYVY